MTDKMNIPRLTRVAMPVVEDTHTLISDGSLEPKEKALVLTAFHIIHKEMEQLHLQEEQKYSRLIAHLETTEPDTNGVDDSEA